VLVVVDFHRFSINVRLKRAERIRQFGQSESHQKLLKVSIIRASTDSGGFPSVSVFSPNRHPIRPGNQRRVAKVK
jgi:hypothetical protein